MPTAETTTKPVAAVKTDIEQLKDDVRAIREDFASLASTTRKIASKEAMRQARRASDVADKAAETAVTYRDLVGDKVKDHPFASLGIAALTGLILSSMRRR